MSGITHAWHTELPTNGPDELSEWDDGGQFRRGGADKGRAVQGGRMGRTVITILHISDMQFGAMHRFGADGVTPADQRHSSLAARLLGDLAYLKNEYDLSADLLVVSGDLAERAMPAEFEQVHDFLAELASGLQLGQDRVVLVPGNHDVNWAKCQGYFLDCEGDGNQPVPPYWPKLEPYTAMFQRFYRGVPGVTFPKDQPQGSGVFRECPLLS